MHSKFEQEIINKIRSYRESDRENREKAFRDSVSLALDKIFEKEESSNFIKNNIIFNRNISKIHLFYKKICSNASLVVSVVDLDGVLVPPFYRYDWVQNKGYQDLREQINTCSNKIIYFSNRIKIPDKLYNLIVRLSLHYALPGAYSNQVPLFIPNSLITKNSGRYRSIVSNPNSDILLNLASPNIEIDLVNKTSTTDTLGESLNFPSFQYLNKSDKSQRFECKNIIYNSLINGAKVVLLGSSKYDREFYLELINFITNTLNKNKRQKSILSNLYYLDSNLTFV